MLTKADRPIANVSPDRSSVSPFPAWFAGILVAALLLRVIVAVAHGATPGGVVRLVPDDSYYYFVPVRNFIAGNGISFDGVNPTNGFHPLWFAILVPIFAVLGNASGDTPIVIAQLVGGACAVGAGYMLWRALRLLAGPPTAGIIATIYLFNPFLIGLSLDGLETGLHMLCSTTMIVSAVRCFDHDPMRWADARTFGVLAGLTLLARTDSVILIGLISLVLLARGLTNGMPGMIRQFGRLTIAGGVAALVCSPWLLWNFATFGSISQSSGTALADIARAIWTSETNGDALLSLLALTGHNFSLALSRAGLSILTLVLLLPIAPMLVRRVRDRLVPRDRPAIWMLIGLLYVVCYTAFHTIVRWVMRDWYYASVLTMVYVVLALPVALLFDRLRRLATPPLWAIGIAAIALISGWVGLLNAGSFAYWGSLWGIDGPVKFPGQPQMERAAIWVAENLPAGTRVGVWNAGIMSYMSERTVINLDGVMNAAVQPFLRDRQLLCYIHSEQINYVADFTEVINFFAPLYTPTGGLPIESWATEVYSAELAGASDYEIWAVDPDRLAALLDERGACASP